MTYKISIENYHKKGLSIAIRDENSVLVEKENARFSALKEKLNHKLNSDKYYMLFDRLRKEQIDMVKEAIEKANLGVIEVFLQDDLCGGCRTPMDKFGYCNSGCDDFNEDEILF